MIYINHENKEKENLTRQWIMAETAERLKKEEAYHQFVSGLSEDDYKLIRNKNLLGIPGEKTMEELQLLLDQAKENLAAQSNVCDLGAESSCAEAPEENLSEESILQWINTFCHTGSAILSWQNHNQIWRALSQRSSDTGEFQFRLKMNTFDEFQNFGIPWEGYINMPYLNINGCQLQQINRSQPSNSLKVRQNRTKASNMNATTLGVMRGSRRQYTREGPSSWMMGRFRNGAQEFRERFTDCHSSSRPIQFSRHVNAIILREAHERNESTRFQRHRERNNSPMSNLRKKIETLKLRSTQNSNYHSRVQRPTDIRFSRRKQIHKKLRRYHQHCIVQNEQERQGSAQFSHSSALLRTLSTTARCHTTLRLNLRVKVLPEEEIEQDNISSRTQSSFQRPRGANRSNRGIFQLVISRSENNGPSLCFRTSWLPLHGISEPEFPQSRVLQVLLQQILAGLSTLNFSNETQAYLEKQRYNQSLWDINSELFNLNRIRVQRELNGTLICFTNERHARQNNDVSNLIENIIIPTLRLARTFLLSDDSLYCSRGLTNEELDNLAAKNYESSINGEINKACSICVNTYTQGNKLRQLPCTHEFHVHCIDRWLAENNTCPICRQAVLNSNTV